MEEEILQNTTDAHLAGNHAGLEQLFRARVIAFLVEARLLPVDRARMLRGWVHSGFNVHLSRRIAANECQDIERLAQYIFRRHAIDGRSYIDLETELALGRQQMADLTRMVVKRLRARMAELLEAEGGDTAEELRDVIRLVM